MKEEINFVNFRKEQGLELIQLWRKSFAHAMGIQEDTREEVVNEHLAYLQTYNPEIIRVAVEKKIPLIIWGENSQAEYGGPKDDQEKKYLDQEIYLICFTTELVFSEDHTTFAISRTVLQRQGFL